MSLYMCVLMSVYFSHQHLSSFFICFRTRSKFILTAMVVWLYLWKVSASQSTTVEYHEKQKISKVLYNNVRNTIRCSELKQSIWYVLTGLRFFSKCRASVTSPTGFWRHLDFFRCARSDQWPFEREVRAGEDILTASDWELRELW